MSVGLGYRASECPRIAVDLQALIAVRQHTIALPRSERQVLGDFKYRYGSLTARSAYPKLLPGKNHKNEETVMESISNASAHRAPWNKGKLVGQKSPLRLREIWAIRIRLQLAQRTRELALFNLAVNSKLRSCDLVRLRVRDVAHGDHVSNRAIVMQQKTRRPVQFEITEQTRESVTAWIRYANRRPEDYLFPSRLHISPHLSTRQYARIVRSWVREIGLNPAE